MTVLSDKWIRKMSKEQEMISPFEEKQVRGNSISYGLSSFGYDARVDNNLAKSRVRLDNGDISQEQYDRLESDVKRRKKRN